MRILFLFFMLVLAGMYCNRAEAGASMHVTLYPSGGRVQINEELTVTDGKLVFELPFGASLDSLSVSLSTGNILGWEVTPVAGREGTELALLREKLEQARQRAARLEGELAGIHSRIALWENQRTAASPEMLDALAKRMSDSLPGLYEMQVVVDSRFGKAMREVELLERVVKEKGETREASRITARVHGVSGKAQVHYAYNLTNCGWQPVYRLNALPDTDSIEFVQEAEVRQGTGQDWKNVELTLSSGSPVDVLSPLPLEEWKVRPARNLKMHVAGDISSDMTATAVSPILSRSVPQEERAVSSVWSLGVQSVPAGNAVRLPVENSVWKARFVRLARPSSSPETVFLMAEVSRPDTLIFPSGKASYMVDGIPVGTERFSTDNWDGTLFLGADPRVSVDMNLDVQQSGQQGFVDKRQTRVWTWTFAISNHHSIPVDVRIEDPAPQSMDEAIKIVVSSSPKPENKNHVLVWNLTVPANGSESILHSVEASAPEDMPLLEGR